MAANRDDEPGVLGNLPRSRPGRRSDKRASTTARAKKAPAAKPATAQRRTAARPQAKRSAPPRQAPAQASGGDPVGQAVQLAGKVAAVGIRTAAGIVKRLPRL